MQWHYRDGETKEWLSCALRCCCLFCFCLEGQKQSSSSTSPVHNMQSYYRRYLTDTGEAAIWSSLSLAERKTVLSGLSPGC